MAKLTTGHDCEFARWRKPTGHRGARAQNAPYEMVLTANGRLLYKDHRGGHFKPRRRGVTVGQAAAQAAMFDLERVGQTMGERAAVFHAPQSAVVLADARAADPVGWWFYARYCGQTPDGAALALTAAQLKASIDCGDGLPLRQRR